MKWAEAAPPNPGKQEEEEKVRKQNVKKMYTTIYHCTALHRNFQIFGKMAFLIVSF